MSRYGTLCVEYMTWAPYNDVVNIFRTADIIGGIFKFFGSGKIRTRNSVSLRCSRAPSRYLHNYRPIQNEISLEGSFVLVFFFYFLFPCSKKKAISL